MGSGLGSIPWEALARELPKFIEVVSSLQLDFETVPLRDVAKVWNNHSKRVVFVP